MVASDAACASFRGQRLISIGAALTETGSAAVDVLDPDGLQLMLGRVASLAVIHRVDDLVEQ